MIRRGQVWWADLGEPRGSAPGRRRPVVVVQRDSYNSSAIRTTLVATLTTNLRLAGMPGNVLVPAAAAGLDEASVLNVTQLATVDRVDLIEHVGSLDGELMTDVDDGLRRVLDL